MKRTRAKATPAILQARFQTAVQLHGAGRLAEAERVYGEILKSKPDHAETLHYLGVIALQTGRLERGADLIGRAVALAPNMGPAHNNLGAVLTQLRRPKDALAAFDRAAALQPDNAEPHCNRGNALNDLGRGLEAIDSFSRALALRPDYPEAFYNRAIALGALGRWEDSLSDLSRAVALNPRYAKAHFHQGVTLASMGRKDQALAAYQTALAVNPDFAEAHNNLGAVLFDLGRHAEAVPHYERALALQPAYAEARHNLGNALTRLGQHDQALARHDQAIALRPTYAEAHGGRGAALAALGQAEAAVESFRRAIALKPDFAEAHTGLGNALASLNRFEEALACHRAAIAYKPDLAEAHFNLGLCLLTVGDITQGFREYEWRKALPEPIGNRDYDQPVWTGAPLGEGATLFVHHEQGFGDTLQFSRYLKDLPPLGFKVVASVQASLRDLIASLDPNIEVIGERETPARFDAHCSLMSLPLALGATLTNPPAEPNYLWADEARRSQWRARLGPRTRPRIGLAWSGNASQRNDRNRSMPFAAIRPLLSEPADWASLQKDIRADDRALVEAASGLLRVADDLKDFSDTAALADLMDLVVTVDTSVAHLAGALGKPTWVLLTYNADWRWLTERTDSPWYPSLRLFRQDNPGDWTSVVAAVRRELRARFGWEP